jgi:hypothetical protein
MPTPIYPSWNDKEYDLLKKMTENTALIADYEIGDVASVAGTANQLLVNGGTAAATGNITLSLPSTLIAPGNLTVSGTGNSSVAGNLGIGETSPVVPLHVKTTGTGTGDFDNAIATLRSTAAGRTITLQFSDTANQAYISSKSGALNFGVGGATLGMSLSSGGNLTVSGTGNSTFAGNLGLGVTPSSWGSGWNVLQPKGGSIGSNGSNSLYINNNAYYDGSDWRYVASSDATRYAMLNSEHYWYNANTGTAGNVITFTQAMTLKASGNLLIGTTTDAGGKLQIATGASNTLLIGNDATYTSYNQISLNGTRTNSGVLGMIGGGAGDSQLYLLAPTGGALLFQIAASTRFRVNSSGDGLFTGSVYAEKAGAGIAGQSTGSITQFTTVNSTTYSVTTAAAKVFVVQLGSGDAALCYTSYKSSTITILGSDGTIVNSNSPSSTQLGIWKGANDHVIYFVTGSNALAGSYGSWGFCFLGNPIISIA